MGMLLAIVGTLLHHDIVRYDWIIGGLVVGTIIGIPLGVMVFLAGGQSFEQFRGTE